MIIEWFYSLNLFVSDRITLKAKYSRFAPSFMKTWEVSPLVQTPQYSFNWQFRDLYEVSLNDYTKGWFWPYSWLYRDSYILYYNLLLLITCCNLHFLCNFELSWCLVWHGNPDILLCYSLLYEDINPGNCSLWGCFTQYSED